MFQFIMRALWLVPLIVVCFARADTYPRQGAIDAQHYLFVFFAFG